MITSSGVAEGQISISTPSVVSGWGGGGGVGQGHPAARAAKFFKNTGAEMQGECIRGIEFEA